MSRYVSTESKRKIVSTREACAASTRDDPGVAKKIQKNLPDDAGKKQPGGKSRGRGTVGSTPVTGMVAHLTDGLPTKGDEQGTSQLLCGYVRMICSRVAFLELWPRTNVCICNFCWCTGSAENVGTSCDAGRPG